jgi:hypothetical protein
MFSPARDGIEARSIPSIPTQKEKFDNVIAKKRRDERTIEIENKGEE